MPAYTAESWWAFLATGSGKMLHVIKEGTTQLTANDKSAVIEYMMSLSVTAEPEVTPSFWGP